VSQLSLFSADARPARVADLAGLLCGPGQALRFGTGDTARISIVLPDPARADAVVAACAAAGVPVTPVRTESGATALRTAFRRDLVELATRWTRGATKAVPPGMQLEGRVLRMWALAAGWPDGRGGYVLALDPHAPETHLPLIAAATRAGIPPARVGRPVGAVDAVAPRIHAALRFNGVQRIRRLVELVGAPPPGLAASQWPRSWGRGAHGRA
jgi:hypothetical protein